MPWFLAQGARRGMLYINKLVFSISSQIFVDIVLDQQYLLRFIDIELDRQYWLRFINIELDRNIDSLIEIDVIIFDFDISIIYFI